MVGPFRYDWQIAFFTGYDGRHYCARVSEYLTLDVFRRNEGSTWEWCVIGNDMSHPDQPLIVKFGTAGTMKEAKTYAELQIKDHPQQTVWPVAGHEGHDHAPLFTDEVPF